MIPTQRFCKTVFAFAFALALGFGCQFSKESSTSGTVEISGRVHAPVGFEPQGRHVLHVVAYDRVGPYNWPYWRIYGLRPQERLDAHAPQPLAQVTLEEPGEFILKGLPADRPIYLFAVWDLDETGGAPRLTAGDMSGRFHRNPLTLPTGESVDIPLTPVMYGSWTYQFPRDEGSPIRFANETLERGVTFFHEQSGNLGEIQNIIGSGVALGDIEGDGDIDLYFVNGLGEPNSGAQATTNILFLNDGNGFFSEAGPQSGVYDPGMGMGAIFADYDDDGRLDIFVTNLGKNRLFRNLGGMFEDMTDLAGVGDEGFGVGAAFGDLDADGDLDLYVANYVDSPLDADTADEVMGQELFSAMQATPFAYSAQQNIVYRNNGDGTFTDQTSEWGGSDPKGKGMAVVIADLLPNHEGQEILITNDCTADTMLIHEGGRLVNRSRRIADVNSGMGIALLDFDLDGILDVFSSHWWNEENVLYQGPELADVTAIQGLTGSGHASTGWGVVSGDIQLDGRPDLWLVHGHTAGLRIGSPLIGQDDFTLINAGPEDWRMVDEPAFASSGSKNSGRGIAAADLNGDGLVDFVINNFQGLAEVWINQSEPQGNWLKIKLRGKAGNRHGVGATVIVEAGGLRQAQAVTSGISYLSDSPKVLHFGVGPNDRVEMVTVRWPDGSQTTHANLEVNKTHVLRLDSP